MRQDDLSDDEVYSVSVGEDRINWWDVIEEGIYWCNAGNHPKAEQVIMDMFPASNRWVTCAVGNECKIIPRDHLGVPEDRELKNWGVEFSNQLGLAVDRITDDDLPKQGRMNLAIKHLRNAKKVLRNIEERSEELIIKIQKESR